jgi:hypothetical protein
MTESIDDLDEAGLLGYFESIKSNFLTKFILLTSIIEEKGGVKKLSLPFDATEIIAGMKKHFDNPVFFSALDKGNEEIVLNLQEDLISGAVIQSWSVFEQILKTLESGNYASSPESSSVNYQRGIYQFTGREKKDLQLFYYIRNDVVHYNGAYYSYRSIDHRYNGTDFKSQGSEGKKIVMPPATVYKLIEDLERYATKAWQNAK